ncbi:MAG: hypothetical protein ABW007_07900 [Chitinophagaceae bacterium]
MKSEHFLRELLLTLEQTKDESFSGIGLIIYTDFDILPVAPLIDKVPSDYHLPVSGLQNIATFLIRISSFASDYHDGFHLISATELKLTHICQYFSPPISKNLNTEYFVGGRYRAAQYGSMVNGVELTGVIGSKYGPTVFYKGHKA